jgi:hypothetical protein
VKGIKICSNEGDSPSPRGDNSERVKIDSRIERPGCSKTFIHDGESYQLMTINAVY